jgi:hypothetical protein
MIAKYMPNLNKENTTQLAGARPCPRQKMSSLTLALMAFPLIRPEPTHLPADPVGFLCPRLSLSAENEKPFLELWLWTF